VVLLLLQPAPSGEAAPETSEFIPPPAERPAGQGVRMPRLEELPVPAQNEIRAWRGELPQEEHPGRRKSLLERLASVGLGRREQAKEDEAPAPAPAPRLPQPAPQLERLPGRPTMPRPAESRPEPVSEYAKRPAPQGLDQHGRQAPPVHNKDDQDQLEIPAFLRRQAH